MNSSFVDDLQQGKTVKFRPKGGSMTGKIESGNLVTVEPLGIFEKGDIVFCKVKGNYYVHLVSAVQGERYQISNNKGYVNGWIGKNAIYGKVTKVEL